MAELCGVNQLFLGLEAGIEGAVHVIRELFDDNRGSSWGLLLIDAKNVFNSLNRAAALWNVRVQWPRCSYSTFTTVASQNKHWSLYYQPHHDHHSFLWFWIVSTGPSFQRCSNHSRSFGSFTAQAESSAYQNLDQLFVSFSEAMANPRIKEPYSFLYLPNENK